MAHAARYLAKEAADLATVRWAQHGFRNAAGQVPEAMTFRNQFGQLDGSSNLQGEEGEHVWITDPDAPAWLRGGTTMVVRRIHMNLDKWDELDRPGREVIVGRRLGDGAPSPAATSSPPRTWRPSTSSVSPPSTPPPTSVAPAPTIPPSASSGAPTPTRRRRP